MQCNLNTNSNVAFGGIRVVGGGKQFLEKTLSSAEKIEFNKLVNSQKSNPVDVCFAQHTEKRLCGWTYFQDRNTGEYFRKDSTQRVLFDSPMNFVKRLCKSADELKAKYFGKDNTSVKLDI